MKNFRQLAFDIAAQLESAHFASPQAEARLIAEAAGEDRFFNLSLQEISAEAEAKARSIVARRLQKEPLQYILGTAPFRELELSVTRDVLIPRPETELLAGFCIGDLPEKGSMLDLGTGSGAIALAVAFERRDVRVTAVDLSEKALAVARKNGEKYQLNDRVKWLCSDLFSAVGTQRFDVIAANLPYVTDEEYATLDEEVRDFEPRLALTSSEAGLQHIFRAIGELDCHLNLGGKAFFELSPPQAEIVAAKLQETGFASEILFDLTRRARFVAASKR